MGPRRRARRETSCLPKQADLVEDEAYSANRSLSWRAYSATRAAAFGVA
jgi:hypothetical protein